MYKYSTFSEYSITNIINRELFMNHYDSFNDPFECWYRILEDFPNYDEPKRLEALREVWGCDKEFFQEHYNSYVEELSGSDAGIDRLINHARISCFCKEPDNLLMWAHYANGMRGFCLEFDRKSLVDERAFVKIYEVDYREEPAEIDLAIYKIYLDQSFSNSRCLHMAHDSNDKTSLSADKARLSKIDDDLYRVSLATKPREWEYEEEIRVVVQTPLEDKVGYSLEYPHHAIKSLIVGEKMPSKMKLALKEVFESSKYTVAFKTAKRNKDGFTIRLEDGLDI